MSITVCTGKLHRVHVTDAKLDYQGSITIDANLMAAAGIVPYQVVHINSLSNAAHWETYAIVGEPGSGVICLNGSPARLFQPGDMVIILALADVTREEAATMEHRVVHVDERNRPTDITVKRAADIRMPSAADVEAQIR